jgi:hypothetical protein
MKEESKGSNNGESSNKGRNSSKCNKSISNKKSGDADSTLPHFLHNMKVKKFVESGSGDVLYIKETGECWV